MQPSTLKHLYQTIKRLADANFDKKLSFLIATSQEKQGTTTALIHTDTQHITIDEEHDLHIFYNQHGIILEINHHAWQNLAMPLPQFLKKLNKCHRNLRISGFLFFMDISNLLIDDNATQANIVKAHTQHLFNFINALDYPVRSALVVTKLDQITGFTDYYGFSHQIELEQALGFSIPTQHTNPKFNKKFSETWSTFINHLNQHVIQKIHNTRGNKKRILIREFPLQLALLEQKFLLVLKNISHPKAHIHGIYFTCSEQRGKNVNFLNQKIENALSMISPITSMQSVNYRHFFIRGAILHCQELATYTPKRPIWHDKKNLSTLGFGAIFSIWLIWSSLNSHLLLSDTQDKLHHHHAWAKGLDYHQQLNLLESCFNNLQRLPFIFTQSSDITKLKKHISQAEIRLFQNHIQPEYDALIKQEMQNRDIRKSFNALKVYKILSLKKKDQTEFALQWIENNLQTPQSKEQLALFKKLLWQIQWQADEQAMESTQALLNALPTEYLVYQLINPNLIKKTKNIQIPGFQPEKLSLPDCFTKAGFYPAQNQIKNGLIAFKKDAWVLDKEIPQNLESKLIETYTSHYVNYWKNLYKEFKPQHFNSFLEANSVFETLQTQKSFEKITALIADQTAPNIKKSKDLFNQKISSQFTELHFSQNSDETIHHYWKDLKQFTNTFLVIDNHGQASFQYLRAYFNQTQYNDVLYRLGEMSKHMPEPMASWLNQINEDIWLSLFQSTKTYLNEMWYTQVIQPYKNEVLGHYPFNESGDEINIAVFEEFFSPNGRIQQFFRDYLQAFINTNQAQWEIKIVNDKQLPIKTTIIDALIQANVISNMFFPNNASHSRIQFSLEKMSLDPVIAQLKFSIGSQTFNDNQQESNPIANFNWPETNSSLKIQTIDGENFALEEQGQWALFKLLQQVNVIPDPNDPSALQVLLEINGNSGRYLLKTTTLLNPFTPGILSNFDLEEKITN